VIRLGAVDLRERWRLVLAVDLAAPRAPGAQLALSQALEVKVGLAELASLLERVVKLVVQVMVVTGSVVKVAMATLVKLEQQAAARFHLLDARVRSRFPSQLSKRMCGIKSICRRVTSTLLMFWGYGSLSAGGSRTLESATCREWSVCRG